ncbi:RTA1 like protein, partial [Cenococcum geophilum 1.58]|uniref:RTA1 like protein n=1 Tax=Cenococcum geophilum 1.58 TaxID=794803 RepID=UPI00358F6B6E
LLAASIYMILGRIITLTDGDSRSMIKRRWITKIFVAGDIISFLGQSAGGGILANAKTDSQVTLGERAITGGLIAQLLFFGFFIIVAGNFHFRMARKPTSRSLSLGLKWQTYLLVLYFASILIMVRSVFRAIEYIQGSNGFLLRREMYLYLFDAALMFITMLLFNFAHPSKVIVREK